MTKRRTYRRYMAPLDQRFWSWVNKTDGCWIWMGHLNQGRGFFAVTTESGKKRTLIASRFAWELSSGRPIPKGISVLHKCDNPTCVRPEHLFLGTQKDNMRDAATKGRITMAAAREASARKRRARALSRTHCTKGHPLQGSNLIHERGKPRCWLCRLEWRRKHDGVANPRPLAEQRARAVRREVAVA